MELIQNQRNTLFSSYSTSYEYRYELNTAIKWKNESRLILLLAGRHRRCIDWCGFSVTERLLSEMRLNEFSILAICTNRYDYEISMPIQNNSDAYSIYMTFRKWMKAIYLKLFQSYPRLYLFGVRRGSRMCSLLSRVLPVQAQILYVYSGYKPSLLIHSDYDRDMRDQLVPNPTFANWFYFEFCSQNTSLTRMYCIFQDPTKNFFNPVPPTYFIHAQNDRLLNIESYSEMISKIQNDAFQLGGTLLTDNCTIKFSVAIPARLTPEYMCENFNKMVL
ncbi:unnamed protein product [Adineta ricciae]|nr:unnamed protein product [Adineta ricciae]